MKQKPRDCALTRTTRRAAARRRQRPAKNAGLSPSHTRQRKAISLLRGSIRATQLDRLLPELYPDLQRLAARVFARESAGHLLEPAALVNEAYLRLRGQRTTWRNREHFFALAGQLMRRILIDHARRARAVKRVTVVPELSARVVAGPDAELLTLEQALEALAAYAPRQHDVVRLRCFGGLTVTETAHALGVSPATVKLDWRLARTWLAGQLAGPGEPSQSETQ